jgi:hypothetical protein
LYPFFPLCLRPSAVRPWYRVPSAMPSPGAPPWLPQTLRAGLAPLPQRVQRPLWVVSTTANPLCTLGPSAVQGGLQGYRAPGRRWLRGGAAHGHWTRRAPPLQAPERRSQHRPKEQGPRASVLRRVPCRRDRRLAAHDTLAAPMVVQGGVRHLRSLRCGATGPERPRGALAPGDSPILSLQTACRPRSPTVVPWLTSESVACLWVTGCGSGFGMRTRATIGGQPTHRKSLCLDDTKKSEEEHS